MNTLFLLGATVTRDSPAFHNPGHIRLWNDTPLRNFEPHLVSAIILLIIIVGIGYFVYFKRKDHLNEGMIKDEDDEKFRELVAKKNIVLNKILETEEDYEAGKLTEEEMKEKVTAYKKYLYKIKQDLNKFLD